MFVIVTLLCQAGATYVTLNTGLVTDTTLLRYQMTLLLLHEAMKIYDITLLLMAPHAAVIRLLLTLSLI